MTDGMKTSEFYTMVVSAIVSVLSAIEKMPLLIQAILMLGTIVIICFYIWSRTIVKSQVQ